MKKVVVASKNPVKVQATLEGFKAMFPGETFEMISVSVASGVSDQPYDDEETYRGAYNRAHTASTTHQDADFWVGLEGGIEVKGDEMEVFAWMVVCSKDGRIGKGRTSAFFLPPKIAQLIHEGKELGEADDIVFGRTNSKQSNGAVGILTSDNITRTTYYREAIILALIPFRNLELYEV